MTLMELVLVLGLLMLLVSVTIGALHGMLASTKVADSASRMASLLRAARADAANKGRHYRLSFEEETLRPVMTIEPRPLEEPGVYLPCLSWWAKAAELADGVSVAVCELTGASAFSDVDTSGPASAEDDESALANVTFYPDGSSDSARIVLIAGDADRPWVVEITLNGVDGTIETRQLDREEIEESGLMEAQ